MGQVIPEPPIDYGNDCPSCTPARWPANETPKFVYCQFWGITNCGVSSYPAPNGEIFKMEQLPGNACMWRSDGDIWKPDWTPKRIGLFGSALRLLDKDGFSFFNDVSLQCPLEGWQYTNDQAACILMYAGAGGFGTIWWNDKIVQLIEYFGFRPGTDLFFEFFDFIGIQNVYKFCDLEQRTNLKIKSSR